MSWGICDPKESLCLDANVQHYCNKSDWGVVRGDICPYCKEEVPDSLFYLFLAGAKFGTVSKADRDWPSADAPGCTAIIWIES